MNPHLPPHLKELLPVSTRKVWAALAGQVPASAYLVGGTALAAHLGHRKSRDLDFFTSQSFQPRRLARKLETLGKFVATQIDSLTLNGVLEDTPVQFLDASDQRRLEPLMTVGGIRVAGLGDLLATKLNVIGHRGELRDYFDLMVLEKAGRSVEEGLELFERRYRPEVTEPALLHIIQGLAHFDDVSDDPGLPIQRSKLEAYWRRRQPQILGALGSG